MMKEISFFPFLNKNECFLHSSGKNAKTLVAGELEAVACLQVSSRFSKKDSCALLICYGACCFADFDLQLGGRNL